MPLHVFIVSGEASGDAHGADLMERLVRLEPGIRFDGLGGPRMSALSEGGIEDWSGQAVIGVVDVLRNYGYFAGKMRRIVDAIGRERPDALVLIDYPGFNLRLAGRIRRECPGVRIIYYISPQVWAWNRGRIPRMARMLDLMLCIFPFEEGLYEEHGLPTEFVGHPMVDRLTPLRSESPREDGLVALLPGSRRREVERIFPVMLGAARLLVTDGLRFEATVPREDLADGMRRLVADSGLPASAMRVSVGRATDLMRGASAGLVASGTATLEAAFFGLPFALVYRVPWATYWPARLLIRVPYLGMVNILAGRAVVSEYIQGRATPGNLAGELRRLLDDGAYRARVLGGCREAVIRLGSGGASERAARSILAELRPSDAGRA